MNIYSIRKLHASQKNHEVATICLLLAENEEEVYEFIKSEPIVMGERVWNGWADSEGEDEEFKCRMLEVKGQMNDEEYEWCDLYYGLTLYGWDLLLTDTKVDYNELIESGFMVEYAKLNT